MPKHFNSRSQDLEEAWHDAGQFYWEIRIFRYLREISLVKLSVPIPIPPYRVQDIDTQEDWDRAVCLFEATFNSAHKVCYKS